MRLRCLLPGLTLALASSAALLASAASFAQEGWPAKPIRLIIPFATGGSNDVIGRRIALDLSQRLGQPIVVENRGGGGGTIGAQAVATAPADGYTLLFMSSSLATSAAVQKTPYDPVRAFDPVSRVAAAPFVLVTRSDLPVKTFPEFVEYAKANPGKLNYGSAGLGDNSQLATELLNDLAGIRTTAVNYKGTGPALLDLVAGRIDLTITSIASIRGTVADTLPKIAFTGAQRDAEFPDIPTISESGLDYVVELWWGVFAPAGTPAPIRDRLNQEIAAVVKDQGFATFLKSAGAIPSPSTSEELRADVAGDIARWSETAAKAGLKTN
ncbi:tripartite tricarboxylate transporter substrate binding protein [Bordetella sp. BOR01]|uniref:Bug family tripartite tricarboxylate transporter substrate binding protein n=1 Tax=Bordetella sp. BOR01 TaxID=2854779 RepID=UPI001C47E3B4|nr:tripartite tricarboxylate transporter substrate-binding protein [Bordetella sp. BOR01]MBV7484133.1 tripartite tricarboxylate transporter substrate binding protein [Bordetella sp. BOR01]